MSLQDKLNENKSMSDLFQETKELNELMTSYIRVHMNEEMAKDLTIQSQLEQIQEKSQEVMNKMQSILNKQENLLMSSKENLEEVLTNGQDQIHKNNQKMIQVLREIEVENSEKLEEMNETITRSIKNMESKNNEVVKKAKKEATNLVSNAKHGALVTNVIDALKYGVATSVITVPILYILLM